MVDLVRDKVDAGLSSEGAWVDITYFGRVKVRRWNNTEYRNAALELRDAKMEEMGLASDEQLPEEASFDVMVRAACAHIIVDWEGITSDGKPVPYTPEMGIATFAEETGAWRDEFYLIVNAATDRANYVKSRREANEKKS